MNRTPDQLVTRLAEALPEVEGVAFRVVVADADDGTLTVGWGVVKGGARDGDEDVAEEIDGLVETAAQAVGLEFTGAAGGEGGPWSQGGRTFSGGCWSQWRPVE